MKTTEAPVYVGDEAGVWHLLAPPGAGTTTLCGRLPKGWPAADWPGRTADAGRVTEVDVCRMCQRVAQRRREPRRDGGR